jgi:hypothetical protein
LSDEPSERAAARADLWRLGRPSRYLLDGQQKGWTHRFNAGDGNAVWCVARQVGKSYASAADDCDFSLQNERAVVRYCAKTKESAAAIMLPTLELILADCPPDIAPRRIDSHVWEWPTTGSRWFIFGTDAESFNRGRGPRTHRLKLDECGFYQDLQGVEAALLPALQTTGGKCLYLSTPSESPGHDYGLRVQAARAAGRLEHATIHSNPRVDVESVIRGECARLGMTREELLRSTYWRREYMAEWVTEESRAAVPAWPSVAEECTRAYDRPPHFDGYTSHDWGGYENDPHAALFGYCDHRAARLIIEDEDEIRGVTLGQLADRWKGKETALWGARAWDGTLWGAGYFEQHARAIPDYLKPTVAALGQTQPFVRVGDNDQQLMGDLLHNYGYAVFPTDRTDKHLLVDDLNQGIREKRVVIHPRCRRLLEQLRTTLWDEKRRQWVRTEKDHGDLIDCALAGTQVQTESGPRAIETLRAGDWVWTRKGLRRVITSARTKTEAEIWRMEASDGSVVFATANHPFMADGEWTQLHRLTVSSTLVAWNQQSWSGAEGCGGGIQGRHDGTTAFTTCTLSGIAKSTSTERNGRKRMGRYLKEWWSTISTAIHSTTKSPTLNASRSPSTRDFTCLSRSVVRWLQGRCVTPSTQPEHGTPLLLGVSGTAETRSGCGGPGHSGSSSASSVVSPSSRIIPAAQPRATPDAAALRVLVKDVRSTGLFAATYNLHVEGEPEYFANGILVHNCLVYMWRNVFWHHNPAPPPPVEYWGKPAENDLEDLARAMTGGRRR